MGKLNQFHKAKRFCIWLKENVYQSTNPINVVCYLCVCVKRIEMECYVANLIDARVYITHTCISVYRAIDHINLRSTKLTYFRKMTNGTFRIPAQNENLTVFATATSRSFQFNFILEIASRIKLKKDLHSY